MSDNYHFDLVCTPIKPSLEIAFQNSPGRKASHWKKVPGRLILAWAEPGPETGFQPFPVPLGVQEAEILIREWLKSEDYGREPDHDGHNTKSWRIYCEGWGHVDNMWQAFVAIEPVWAMHGK